jgi:DNA (cytosine-5)-methyltransferase 1
MNLKGHDTHLLKAAFTHYIHTGKEVYRDAALEYMRTSDEPIPDASQITHADDAKFTFIDLFAGIGGFRIAMQNLGGHCVFTSEWDKFSQKAYFANFGDLPFGDITKQSVKDLIPKEFEILCAGFPCQAFSIAGRRAGFSDTRGTLFHDIATVIKQRKPRAVFLENVKGILNHDRGRTIATILQVLRKDLGYTVPEPKVMNARHFGVPQNRERLFIIGFRDACDADRFDYPPQSEETVCFEDVKEEQEVSVKYYLSTAYLETLRAHRKRHESKGNGFGYEIIPDDGIANAIVVGGMGRERNLVYDDRLTDFTPVTKIKGEVNKEGIRRMTPREWARLQGFPESFKIVVSDAQAYKQFGNSVAVPAIQATAQNLVEALRLNRQKHVQASYH